MQISVELHTNEERETNERKPPKRHHTLTAFICTCVTLVTQWMKILENCLIFP